MRKWILLSIASFSTLIIDQITKLWVINTLELYETIQPIPALVPLFQITRSTNTGIAFGLFSTSDNDPQTQFFATLALVGLAVVIIAVMLWYFRETPNSARLAPIAIGMVIGGAIGNMIDRLQYGHVVDFVHYQIPDLISNVSNLADHGIVLGVLLLIADNLWHDYQTRKLEKSEPMSDSTTGQSAPAETTPLD